MAYYGGVAPEDKPRQRKRERSGQRREAARRRVLVSRVRRAGIVALVLAIPALWAFEYSGPQELVEAEVTETRRWRHYTQGGKSHPHLAATLQIEGLSEATLERADGYTRGQRVQVWIQRGRITSWPRFLDVAEPEELAREPEEEDPTEAP